MPRMGLDVSVVLVKAAEIADEKGLDGVSLGELAQRLNVRAHPSTTTLTVCRH